MLNDEQLPLHINLYSTRKKKYYKTSLFFSLSFFYYFFLSLSIPLFIYSFFSLYIDYIVLIVFFFKKKRQTFINIYIYTRKPTTTYLYSFLSLLLSHGHYKIHFDYCHCTMHFHSYG